MLPGLYQVEYSVLVKQILTLNAFCPLPQQPLRVHVSNLVLLKGK